MCGGGDNPISNIVDTGGNIIDTVGSALGDVASTAGDIISNPIVDATAAIALGQPELLGLDAGAADAAALAGDTFGSSTAADIAANEAASAAAASAAGTGGITDIYNPPIDSFDGPTIPTTPNIPTPQADIYNPPIDSFDGPTIPSTPNPAINQMDPTQGTVTPEDVKNAQINIDSQNSQMEPQGGNASNGNLSSPSWLDKITQAGGTVTDAVKALTKGLTPADYLKGAGILGLGTLAGANQSDLNSTIMNWYNAHNAAQAGKLADYQAGRTPKLNLGTVTPRTAQNVVVMPGKKDGGVLHSKHSKAMHDLVSEYENLRSRRKNFAQGSSAMPFKQVSPFRGISEINPHNPMYLTPLERKAQQVRTMGSVRRGFALGSPESGIASMAPANDIKSKLISLAKSNPGLIQKFLQARAAANQPQMQQNMQSQMQPEAGDGIASALGFKRGGKIPEIDYRDKGGYVPPIGKKERADDIPAMLSNNEFVFTANAVRNAGNGDIKHGAKKMYALMKHLEGKK